MKPIKLLLILGVVATTIGGRVAVARAAMCQVTTNAIAFGNYDVLATAGISSTGTVKIDCTGNAKPISPGVTLDKGAHSTGLPNRNMIRSGGSDLLAYNLYLDAPHTLIWGDGTGGTSTWTAPIGVKNFSGNATVYGGIAPGQTSVSVGQYSDTVGVTINF